MLADIAWYSWLAIYIVGFVVSVFLWTLFDAEDRTFPLSMFWPLVLPFALILAVGGCLYLGPEWLAKKCKEAIAKWGE